MKKIIVLSVAVVAGLLMLCSSLLAHHGTGISYDQTKSVTITGKLTGFALEESSCLPSAGCEG